jgi:hypothetical protein
MPAPRIIGLHGYAQSGKDTVASMLEGYERLAFADRLRECTYALNPAIGVEQWEDGDLTLVRLQEEVDQYGWDAVKVGNPEVRRLLQVFGTEVGRELIKDSLWVDIVLDQMADGLEHDEARFVITDMRFINEVTGLLQFGEDMLVPVELWKITRPGVGPVNTHVSDAGLADDMFDLIIENDGTLEDLKAKVLLAITRGD